MAIYGHHIEARDENAVFSLISPRYLKCELVSYSVALTLLDCIGLHVFGYHTYLGIVVMKIWASLLQRGT